MPNLSSVLKSEITRLARKEIKGAVDPLRKANAGYRRDVAELKRQVAALQRELKSASKGAKRAVATDEAPKANTRFVAKGLKSLRARLGLSAADFGRLVGASGQSVYNWETGKAVPRAGQRETLAALRGLGKREAVQRLESMS
ncbi:helix-turn-helix domain-containing protein [Cognatilysobacter lacus]|uniref:Helix-turn-helix domain-containing protein n=1 Tax=Cognatilysobacter lacus TaxID=1643323 RepID=A0A5D8Z8R5_9GAMM|nr:helix-turn-helix domain-containing protein [Lysobacter lacus]TZF90512.1 helix-turn-helix domain-containing protein [Lysobacter lacus]